MADTHHRGRGRINPWWWVLSGAAALTSIISLVVWFGGQIAPDGESYLLNPDAIVLAIISGAVSISAPLIPAVVGIRKDTAATTQHVVNSHGDRNLRSDIDSALALLGEALVRLEVLDDVRKDVAGMRAEFRQLRDVDGQHAKDIAEVRQLALDGKCRTSCPTSN